MTSVSQSSFWTVQPTYSLIGHEDFVFKYLSGSKAALKIKIKMKTPFGWLVRFVGRLVWYVSVGLFVFRYRNLKAQLCAPNTTKRLSFRYQNTNTKSWLEFSKIKVQN